MRVITGTARGRRLESPQGTDTRPTSEMIKEAVMSIIQFETPGAVFLDLFAGSGQMGIEALSRGARHCTFVDHARDSGALIRRNLETTGLSQSSLVVVEDAMTWLRRTKGPFDVAFLDPPYSEGLPRTLLPELAALMRENGVILVETAHKEELPHSAGGFAIAREYRYGKKKVTKYLRKEDAEGDPA